MNLTEPSQHAIQASVSDLQRDAVHLLAELVRQPSLLGQEHSAQDLMASHFAAMGLEVRRFEIDEEKIRNHPGYSPAIVTYQGRHNVVGTHIPQGPVHGRSLILNGHIDVVPVGVEDMWKTPPFAPRVEGDRLYGRGAADMKAGIVAYCTAMDALRRLGYEPAAPVYLQSVLEEECTGNGALACLVEGYTADAALIPEPTQEHVMRAQIGVLWLTLDVYGLPVHALQAHKGIAAIAFAQYMVEALRVLEAEWNLPEARHPLYCQHEHPINFNLGKLQGGEWTSSVPMHCRADIRIGYYPGKKVADVKSEVESLLMAAHSAHPHAQTLRYKVSYHGFQSEGVVVNLEEPMIKTLINCHQDVTEQAPELLAWTATTDVKFFHLYGNIPSTCYGPTGHSIHGVDEWVSISSMQRVATVYALFIARWCGLNRLR